MSKSKTIEDFTVDTINAAQAYRARRDRELNPQGGFDNAKRWYPSENERCPCCAHVRSPSRAWPFSLMVHCRTAEHVATLFDVDASDLRKAARLLDKAASSVK